MDTQKLEYTREITHTNTHTYQGHSSWAVRLKPVNTRGSHREHRGEEGGCSSVKNHWSSTDIEMPSCLPSQEQFICIKIKTIFGMLLCSFSQLWLPLFHLPYTLSRLHPPSALCLSIWVKEGHSSRLTSRTYPSLLHGLVLFVLR